MRIVNRTAITLTGARPYLEWTRRHEADVNQGMLTVQPEAPHGSVFLLPEVELEEDLQEWIEENATSLFEFQLAAWTEDESAWPVTRDVKTFREWFRIGVHSVVLDAADEEIEGEEL